MAQPPRTASEANIPNQVNRQAIETALKTDNNVKQFAELGQQLLEETNKPNIITLEEFAPFEELFIGFDKDRYKKDEAYELHINQLYNRYMKSLSINKYEPTLVVASKEDGTIKYWLQRHFARIAPDHVEAHSRRNNVPPVARHGQTRDQVLLDAAVLDLMEANRTPEQMQKFADIYRESAFIEHQFVKNNLSQEKRDEVMKGAGTEAAAPNTTTPSSTTVLCDDDD